MLKRFFVVVGVCLALGIAAHAQEFPKAEVFGGYSYGNFGPTAFGAGRTNVNGWNASLGVNVNHWFGLVSDFGGHYGSFSATLPSPIIIPTCEIGRASCRERV